MTACKPGMIEEDQNHFVWLQSLLLSPPPPTFIIFYVYLNSGHCIFISILPPSLLLFVGCCCFYFFSPLPSLSPFIVIFFLLLLCIQGFEEVFRGSGGGLHFIEKKILCCLDRKLHLHARGAWGLLCGLGRDPTSGGEGGGRCWFDFLLFPPLPPFLSIL